MKDKEPYRNIPVCYDNYTQFGWRTAEEFAELLNAGRVTWFSDGKGNPVYVDNRDIQKKDETPVIDC